MSYDVLDYVGVVRELNKPKSEWMYRKILLVAEEYDDHEMILENPRVLFTPLSEPRPTQEQLTMLLMVVHDYAHTKTEDVAVACMAGVNRSVTVATLLRMIGTKKTFVEAYEETRRQRPEAGPFHSMVDSVLGAALGVELIEVHQVVGFEKVTGGPFVWCPTWSNMTENVGPHGVGCECS